MEVNPNLSEKALHDFNLVRRAVEDGDQRAYAELMTRYRDSVYFMLLKMVNNRDDAEDLTIEAFGKAFRNIKQYTPAAPGCLKLQPITVLILFAGKRNKLFPLTVVLIMAMEMRLRLTLEQKHPTRKRI
jgi:hypothetical protein